MLKTEEYEVRRGTENATAKAERREEEEEVYASISKNELFYSISQRTNVRGRAIQVRIEVDSSTSDEKRFITPLKIGNSPWSDLYKCVV